jgi:hypothetical protein
MTQKQVDLLADLAWHQLSSLFGPAGKRPPVYLFLSPQSKGSLKKRTEVEKSFVHHQQAAEGGVTLDRPPCAWVSTLDQVPEECAHLYALQRGQRSKNHQPLPLSHYLLHEAFGRFAEHLCFGKARQKVVRAKLRRLRVWDEIHHFGYALGDRWAEHYFCEKIEASHLKLWFSSSWTKSKTISKLYQSVRHRMPGRVRQFT